MDAYFAGGCFWCMAKPYDEVPGVLSVESGYSGGAEAAPAYEEVKAQKTGHRETVHLTFDPALVSFDELLAVYFYNVDPFDPDGQFIDRGRSYSAAIYYVSEEQRAAASAALERIAREYGRKPCVSLEAFRSFFRAEEYHQDYAKKNPEAYAKEYEESGRGARKDADRVKL